MCEKNCNWLKILCLSVMFVVGISALIFSIIRCDKCRRINGKAHKVFNDMGELIGEFNFINKK